MLQGETLIQGQENPAETVGGQAESPPYLTRGKKKVPGA